MKFSRIVLLSLVFSFALVLSVGAASNDKAKEIVAKVGGIPVTVYEWQRAVQKIVPLSGSYHSGISADKMASIQQEALDDLIERAFKVRAALDLEISVSNEIVSSQIAKLREKYPSDSEFEKIFGAEKKEGYRASLYREYLAKKAEQLSVDDKLDLDEGRVRAAYDKHKAAYFRPIQFRASHIMIKVDPASNKEERAALRARAEDLLLRAKKGEDFYNLAYYNSDDPSKMVGGDLGLFHEGQTDPAFEVALKELKVGEISEIVETRFGYHIVKLTEVNLPRQLEYEEVKDKLMLDMRKKLRDRLYDEWMTSLKSKYTVEKYID